MLAATYIRGIDLLFEDQVQGGVGVLSYYVSDNLGSTRALTNSDGAVTDTYSYDAYGNLIASTGTTVNPYRFTGQWFDAAIGQYYLRARGYNPLSGDFTSRDSYEGQTDAPATLNRYAYATGDPLRGIDPSGHGLGDVLVSISIATTLSGSIGAGVYSQVFHDSALKGFLVGGELGFALAYAYLTGGGGVNGLKKVGQYVGDAFFAALIKVGVKHYDYATRGVSYAGLKQAQDFLEAFSAAAFASFLGETISGVYDSGVDPSGDGNPILNAEEATILASLVANGVNEALSYFSGSTSFLDAATDTISKTMSAFLQSQLFGKILAQHGITGRGSQRLFKGFLMGAYSSALDQLKHILD